ncbi:MAG: hypothetical protein FWG87_01015 [Defluviitaleaceae bacterium]|nr:hypothetical protein [Defluviitaleaceae bacterium]
MKKLGKALDNLAYFFAIMLGVFILQTAFDSIVMPFPIENRQIKNARHIREFEKAFQFELAEWEALYVSNYNSGHLQAYVSLKVEIKGLKSEADFLTRFYGSYEPSSDFMYEDEQGSDFKAYKIDVVQLNLLSRPEDFFSFMLFSSTGEDISVELSMLPLKNSVPEEFRDVIQLLNKRYMRGFRKWLQPIFVVPTLIQWGLIAFIIIRRHTHKTPPQKTN